MRHLSLLLLMVSLVAAQSLINADHPDIRYMGRVDFSNPAQPRFEWPGVQITARFQGSSCAVMLNRGNSHLTVYVNGDSVAHIRDGSGMQTYVVAQGLADSEHDLRIVKRNEGSAVTFAGLQLDTDRGLLALGPRAQHRMEYIGDSYTTCYGCVSRTTTCADLGGATDAWHAYAAVSARAVDAEYSLLAISGRGLLHNTGDPELVSANNMQGMFERALTSSATPRWDSTSWVPQLVVIALGINDIRDNVVIVTQEVFTEHYRQFIARIQNSYPGADVLCLAFNWPDTLAAFVRHAYEEELAAGNSAVHYLHITAGNAGGCDFHPNVGGHLGMSSQLTPVIQNILGLSRTQPRREPRHQHAAARAPHRLVHASGMAESGATLYDIRGRVAGNRQRLSTGVRLKLAP